MKESKRSNRWVTDVTHRTWDIYCIRFYPLYLLAFASCFLPLLGISDALAQVQGQTKVARTSNQEQKTVSEAPPKEVANRLQEKGVQQFRQGQLREALRTLEQVLAIRRELGEQTGEGETLTLIGQVYNDLSQYPKALESLQQALTIHKKLGDRKGEGETLTYLGEVYTNVGQYDRALETLQQALAIQQEVRNRIGEGETLDKLGEVYNVVSQYDKALELLQQALVIRKAVSDRFGEGRTLQTIGITYRRLGKYDRALEFYQQALQIVRVNGDRVGQGRILTGIGVVYDNLGQYPQALEFLQKALTIRQAISDRSGEGATFNSIGLVYDHQGQYERSVDFYQKALGIFIELGNRPGEGRTLNNLGFTYYRLGQYPKALEFLQQALGILKELGDKTGEGIALGNIADLLEKQNQPELAIVFYKQAVNLTETIRKDLRVLPREQQESYTKTVANSYRSLADLLLKQNRVLEAQQVLDLLKVQELQDYLRNVRGNETTAQGVEFLPQEQKVAANYSAIQNKAIQLGKELTQLRKIPEANRTPAQTQRIAELVKAQEAITAEFNQFTRSPEVASLSEQRSQSTANQTLSLRRLKNIQDNLQRLGQGAVLVYPLILEDRLELILTTPDSPPIRRTVAVKREDLNRAIVEFRTVLQNRYIRPIQIYSQLGFSRLDNWH